MIDIFEQTEHPTLQKLYSYWAGLRGNRDFPARSDLDPIDFWFALGCVSLIEVLPDPLRFRYRLVGTNLTRNLGYEMTGKLLDEMPEPEVRAYLLDKYTTVLRERRPILEQGHHTLDRRVWRHETLYLPLSNDGRDIDVIVSCRITTPPKAVSAI